MLSCVSSAFSSLLFLICSGQFSGVFWCVLACFWGAWCAGPGSTGLVTRQISSSVGFQVSVPLGFSLYVVFVECLFKSSYILVTMFLYKFVVSIVLNTFPNFLSSTFSGLFPTLFQTCFHVYFQGCVQVCFRSHSLLVFLGRLFASHLSSHFM